MGDDKAASAARGWDDPTTKLRGRFLRRKNYGGNDEDEDDEDEDFDEDDISEGDFDLDDEYDDDDDSPHRGECDEEAFEKVLEEYEDEQLGYIEDEDEEAVVGTIDLAGGESELLNAAIEEFLAVRFHLIEIT
jgi:hypothetical protein